MNKKTDESLPTDPELITGVSRQGEESEQTEAKEDYILNSGRIDKIPKVASYSTPQPEGKGPAPKVNRVEVIDHYNEIGRAFVFPPKADVEVELSYQDNGKTLKIFLTKNKF